MKRLIAIACCIALTACGSPPPVVSIPSARCADLIPENWSEGVEAEPVPQTAEMDLFDQVKAWAGAFVGQSGQLSKANGRTADAIHIVRECEAMVNAARPNQ